MRKLLRSPTTRWSPALLLSAAGGLAGALLILTLLVILESTSRRFEYFNPVGLVEEAAYTYISARNYQEYGFLNSGFLQDFSHSSDPADHPYVYNHMPPGPDILTSVLLQLFGGSYRLCRLAFAALFVVGLVFYVMFVGAVLKQLQLRGASFTILLIGPWFLMGGLDRQPYSPFLLLGFVPLWAQQTYYRTGRPAYRVLVFGVGLLSALYLEYVLLSAVAWTWVLLWLTQVVRIDRRDGIAFLAAIGLGVLLHLLQNLVYLGPNVFVHELRLLLMNRITGVPSQDELAAFYQQIGLVHHGSHPVQWTVLLRQLALQFELWGSHAVALVALASLLALVPAIRLDPAGGTMTLLRGEATRMVGGLARTWLWISGTILLPNVMFPAFNQEVTLRGSGANRYFLAIAVVATLGSGLRLVTQPEKFALRFLMPVKTLAVALLAALGTLSGALITRLEHEAGDLQDAARSLQQTGRDCLHRAARLLRTRPVVWRQTLFAMGVQAVIVLGVWMAAKEVVRRNLDQLSDVRFVARELRYAGLTDLSAFSGNVFMTNINSPTVGFFVREAGYGVCSPESILEKGEVDVSRCKVALMRRNAVTHRTPRYFLFFTLPELFPGFADCMPSATLPTSVRGGDDCVSATRRSLARNFAEVFDNGVFTAFELRASPSRGFVLDPEIAPPVEVTAAPQSRTSILLSWRDPYRRMRLRELSEEEEAKLPKEFRIERKRRIAELFAEVAVTRVDDTDYLATGLEAGTRHFFRVRTCVGDRCSAYGYAEGQTPR